PPYHHQEYFYPLPRSLINVFSCFMLACFKLKPNSEYYISFNSIYLFWPVLIAEYDIVIAYEVDQNEDYITHEITHHQRRKQLTTNVRIDSLHLQLHGFGHDFHMNLKTSNNLMAPGFIIQTLGKRGTKSIQTYSQEDFCFYQGFLRSHKNSSVSLSTFRVLVSNEFKGICCCLRLF
uniref:Peptidase M12B propeptide domain-containing protein n=1 Tax=Terrapene triunguis TaxID=2587831 RepID=A0A674J0W0_9SAUR